MSLFFKAQGESMPDPYHINIFTDLNKIQLNGCNSPFKALTLTEFDSYSECF